MILMRKIKVLYILPSITQSNGVASYVFNYLDKMDLDIFDVEIVASNLRPSQKFIDFCNEKGIVLHFISNLKEKSIFQFKKDIKEFMKEHHDYDIVHCNVMTQGLFYLSYAKKYKIPVRILHSHATKNADSMLKNIRNSIMSFLVKRKANYYFACSKMAGDYLFKKKKYHIINNAIDMNKYSFNLELRQKIRNELNLDDNFICGFVGRLVNQKNVYFLVDIIERLKELKNNAHLLIVGTGVLEDSLKVYVKNKNLDSYVTFLGERSDAKDLYNSFDCFLLPSIYEGLPVVGIEAQSMGLACYFSNTITEEVRIVRNTLMLPIDDPNVWANSINASINGENIEMDNYSSFDINISVKKLEELYKEIYKEKC